KKNKKKRKISAAPPLRFLKKYLREIKRNNIISSRFLAQQIAIKSEEKSLVKNEQLEAFKIIIGDVENKKKLIENLRMENDDLAKELDETKKFAENLVGEKRRLEELGARDADDLEKKRREIELLRTQIKDFELLGAKCENQESIIAQLRAGLEENAGLSAIQSNAIKTLQREAENRNIKIVEIKNLFVEAFDNYNDLLQRINWEEGERK
ncbi:MAG: hypothetical protein LBB09_02410, partial [Rickettsiales bacterium]|nr:hypothetical protein [Rickettsiales bacterium]